MYRQAGESPRRITEVLRAPQDLRTENAREDLRRVAADPQFRIATVDRLRALGGIPDVSIGNHTNCHFELSLLPPNEARVELDRSGASFERLFGRQRHFAFPFGHGFFDECHVQLLRSLGDSVLWGTGKSPYVPADAATSGLRPRVGIDGPAESRGATAVIAGRSLATRVLGGPTRGATREEASARTGRSLKPQRPARRAPFRQVDDLLGDPLAVEVRLDSPPAAKPIRSRSVRSA